ncbi:Imm42 family immunity protein [Variovorax robiniae]|uniref:Imm42 family immunity protein n=1 Tax=Variovorax robiniae TaxID=1836199 RepID=A0ABU8XJV1_9BURK
MLFGDPKNIAFFYEILHRQNNSHFAFGIFNIFIDDELLLNGGSNWTIDCIIRFFRSTKIIPKIDNAAIGKRELFNRACSTRGYLTHDSPKINSEYWSSNDPSILNEIEAHLNNIDAMRSDPPFGVELPMYSELIDKNIRIFFFLSEESEIIVYSRDSGETIHEKRVPKGTIGALIESLPEVI